MKLINNKQIVFYKEKILQILLEVKNIILITSFKENYH